MCKLVAGIDGRCGPCSTSRRFHPGEPPAPALDAGDANQLAGGFPSIPRADVGVGHDGPVTPKMRSVPPEGRLEGESSATLAAGPSVLPNAGTGAGFSSWRAWSRPVGSPASGAVATEGGGGRFAGGIAWRTGLTSVTRPPKCLPKRRAAAVVASRVPRRSAAGAGGPGGLAGNGSGASRFVDPVVCLSHRRPGRLSRSSCHRNRRLPPPPALPQPP